MAKLTVRDDLVWIDVQFARDSKRAMRFYHDHARWSLDNDVFPTGKGQSGPLGFNGAYTPEDAKKLVAWLKTQGIEGG